MKNFWPAALAPLVALAAQLSPSDLDRVRAGQPAPDFSLTAADNRQVKLSGLRGKDVVLVFYRGYW